jgi:hypothetical protein
MTTLAMFAGQNISDVSRLCTSLGHLGQRDTTDRIISVSVTWSRQGRKVLSYSDMADFLNTNFVNVIEPCSGYFTNLSIFWWWP